MIRRYKEYCWKKGIKKAAKKEGTLPTKDNVIVFDTALHSLNMGDVIIQHYCKKVLEEVYAGKEMVHVPTHVLPSRNELDTIPGVKNKVVCGTNLITPHFEEFTSWKMPENLYGYKDIIALGVGWGYYCDDISPTSVYVYNNILSKNGLHSVRDSYTEKKFKQMGIKNVINTGCPTLWALNKEHCSHIPIGKAKNVITTITDYDRDIESDSAMLEILLKEYETVSVWIQGNDDLDYLNDLIDRARVEIIPNNFDLYSKALMRTDIDYVGTRLHAGIHALNHRIRTLIVAIDNRAIEMGKDVNLPIIMRDDIKEKLKEKIYEKRATEIKIPYEKIKVWKGQFKGEDDDFFENFNASAQI